MAEPDERARQQANVGTLRDLPPRFWLLVVATGIASGFGAIAMMAVLRAVQHAAFAYHTGEYSTAAAHHSDLRLIVVLAVGGLVTGVGLWVMRRFLGGTGGHPTAVVWSGRGRLSLVLTTISGALSEVSIGMGGSIGRENAPQHFGAAFGSWIGERCRIPDRQRMLLIACGAGAGVGAVYNVPFAGALFAAELYLGSVTLGTVVPALLTAAIATAIGWITLPIQPIYHVPVLAFPSASLLVWSALVGPLIGLFAGGWVKLVGWANDRRASGTALIFGPLVAFVILGLIALRYPLLLGNGRDLAQAAFTGAGALGTLAALAALKPLVTALCLRSGAIGGLFTPTFSTGAVLGAFLGGVWAHIWPHAPMAAYAVVGSAALLGAAMRTPVAGIAFAIELTNTVNAAILPMILALAGAMLVARLIDRRSIYSARLQPGPGATDRRAAGGLDGARRTRASRTAADDREASRAAGEPS
jgi:CIC family chloride channel protein